MGDCGAGPVSCMAVKAGEAIKDRGFSGVGVAQKDNGCEGNLGDHEGKAPDYNMEDAVGFTMVLLVIFHELCAMMVL